MSRDPWSEMTAEEEKAQVQKLLELADQRWKAWRERQTREGKDPNAMPENMQRLILPNGMGINIPM